MRAFDREIEEKAGRFRRRLKEMEKKEGKKIIQIAANDRGVFALRADGVVVAYNYNMKTKIDFTLEDEQ